jgi:uncharacterized protein YqhQ
MSERSPQTLKAHSLGGQAVIEGVMMRSPGWWALAVRRPDGLVHTESHEVGSYSKRRPWLTKPLVRGVIGLGETMAIGVRALSTSARVSVGEEDAPTNREIGIAIAIAFVFFVGLFIALPAIIDRGGKGLSGGAAFLHNLREGAVRIGIFLAYILLIARLKDIRRVFEYHGAEHKVIAAHEAGAPRTKEGARPFSTVHVRCGTDFLFLVMLLAVLVFSFVPRYGIAFRIVSRIVLLPVVAAVSYETLRLAARYDRNPLVRIVTYPGKLLQRITTREPADDQLEVALASLAELLRREGLVSEGGTDPPGAA